MTIYCEMVKSNKELKGDIPMIEKLRIERTDYNLQDFLAKVGIPDKTYRRWLAGDTTAKLTVAQFKALFRELKFKTIDDIPDDFSEKYQS